MRNVLGSNESYWRIVKLTLPTSADLFTDARASYLLIFQIRVVTLYVRVSTTRTYNEYWSCFGGLIIGRAPD